MKRNSTQDCFLIGDIKVDPAVNQVHFNDSIIKLSPKEMAVLEVLANHYPDPVPREIIQDQVWNKRVGADELLSRVIADLRKKLKDKPRQSKYIETVIKKGYRIKQPVTRPKPPTEESHPQQKRRQFMAQSALIISCFLMLSFGAFWWVDKSEHSTIEETTNSTPNFLLKSRELILSSPQQEVKPNLSPNGEYIIYSKKVDDFFQLYIYNLSDGHSQALLKVDGRHLLASRISTDNLKVSYTEYNNSLCEQKTLNLFDKKQTLLGDCHPAIARYHTAGWSSKNEPLHLGMNKENTALHILQYSNNQKSSQSLLKESVPDTHLYFPHYIAKDKYLTFVRRDSQDTYAEIGLMNVSDKSTEYLYRSKYIAGISVTDNLILATETDGKKPGVVIISPQQGVIGNIIERELSDIDISTEKQLITFSKRSFNTDIARITNNLNQASDIKIITYSDLEESNLTISPESQLVFADELNKVWTLDQLDNKKELLFQSKEQSFSGVQFSPNGKQLLYGTYSKKNKYQSSIYNLENQQHSTFLNEYESKFGIWINDEVVALNVKIDNQWGLYSYHIKTRQLDKINNAHIRHLEYENNVLYYSTSDDDQLHAINLASNDLPNLEWAGIKWAEWKIFNDFQLTTHYWDIHAGQLYLLELNKDQLVVGVYSLSSQERLGQFPINSLEQQPSADTWLTFEIEAHQDFVYLVFVSADDSNIILSEYTLN